IETDQYIQRELYVIDKHGLVVPQVFNLPKTESAAAQAVQYLVKDGPLTEQLPSGFQAVLPVGTEVLGVNLLEDGTLIVDVSEEFSEYQADDELKMMQAITHTLTQFDGIE